MYKQVYQNGGGPWCDRLWPRLILPHARALCPHIRTIYLIFRQCMSYNLGLLHLIAFVTKWLLTKTRYSLFKISTTQLHYQHVCSVTWNDITVHFSCYINYPVVTATQSLWVVPFLKGGVSTVIRGEDGILPLIHIHQALGWYRLHILAPQLFCSHLGVQSHMSQYCSVLNLSHTLQW